MVTAFRTNLLCATALSIACALAVPAHAQDAASQGEKPEAQEGGLETIVVTAQNSLVFFGKNTNKLCDTEIARWEGAKNSAETA